MRRSWKNAPIRYGRVLRSVSRYSSPVIASCEEESSRGNGAWELDGKHQQRKCATTAAAPSFVDLRRPHGHGADARAVAEDSCILLQCVACDSEVATFKAVVVVHHTGRSSEPNH